MSGVGRRPPAHTRGERPPPTLRPQPRESLGIVAAVTYDRTVAWSPIARARKVTVTRIICGVDVAAETLDARIGRDGPTRHVARTAEGIVELGAFCRAHQAALVLMADTGGVTRRALAPLSLTPICPFSSQHSAERPA